MTELRDIPIRMLVPSPFETRKKVTLLETAGDVGILQPLLVQPRDGKFEILCGHRRLETLKVLGVETAPCEVKELVDDEQAAKVMFFENQDREELSDFERGLFFKKYLETFHVSERELARRLGLDHATISRCIGIVEARARVVIGITGPDPSIYERVVTTNKFAEVNRLSEEHKTPTLQAGFENRLSTTETIELVKRVKCGVTPTEAANEVVLEREARKPERYAERKRRVECPTCLGRGYLLRGDAID